MASDLAGQLIDAVSLAQDDVTCVPAPASPATTTGSGFDPGNIISDAVFYNTGAMTVEQIREFLRPQGEGCTGAVLPEEPAGQHAEPARRPVLRGLPGRHQRGRGRRHREGLGGLRDQPAGHAGHAAEGVGAADRTDPTASTYDAAWGWHCPDTGPGGSANCDPAYAGFFNQGYGMAKQWSRYKLDPEKYNYRAGQTVDILWNVAESGCGRRR